ncbi:MAG TPA: hypothetical protein VM910_32360 [Bradyrhizobium sp.]|nr:hypothetical protein [Bradyrhizobium sp.]
MARASHTKSTRTPHRPTRAPANPGWRAKVRMYRQGLRDCFLVSLPRAGSRPYSIMIDCGVILGTPADGRRPQMKEVVDNIVATTQGEIDLLVVTHEHWDHVSGFVQAKESFRPLKVHALWLAWTEDPEHELARKLRRERDAALSALRLGLSQLQLAGAKGAVEIAGVLEFLGAAKGTSTSDALAHARSLVRKPRYCLPAEAPTELPDVGARIYVLGPPPCEKRLRKIRPSMREKETYGLGLEALPLFMAGIGAALEGGDAGRPFDRKFEIPKSTAARLPFFRDHYCNDDRRRIEGDWLMGIPDIALQLDSLTNNTSLVLAIELADGDVLLFAADAQVGNWLSWQDLAWPVGGRTVTGPDLLNRTILYKVGHHGSHNATLRHYGLELMKRLRVAMLPVDEEMAKRKGWTQMPLPELVTALEQRASGGVLRVDRPSPVKKEQVIEDRLFFEVVF